MSTFENNIGGLENEEINKFQLFNFQVHNHEFGKEANN